MMSLGPIMLLLVASGCVVVEGDQVTFGDLRRTSPTLPASLATLSIGFSPQPGEFRLFTRQQIASTMARYGHTDYQGPDVCVERAAMRLTDAQIMPVLMQSLKSEGKRVEIVAFASSPLPSGLLEFPRNGLKVEPRQGTWLWRGRVVYGPSRTTPVWVRIRLFGTVTRFIARRPIQAGHLIESEDVSLETREGPIVQFSSWRGTDSVLGSVARRDVSPGAVVTEQCVRRPIEVQRGRPVEVWTVASGLQLRMQAVAETSGVRGASILVRSAFAKKPLHALVCGPGLAVLTVPPAAAKESSTPTCLAHGIHNEYQEE
jgi:flagella basal body P-ring formation protein FlgA